MSDPRNVGPREYDRVLGVECVCNVGVQECPIHPGRLRTQDERVQFRIDFDERVAAGKRKEPEFCSVIHDPTGWPCELQPNHRGLHHAWDATPDGGDWVFPEAEVRHV